MKTIKWLKISFFLQAIFLFFCIASILCFWINCYTVGDFFFDPGNLLMYGWMLNPTGPITLAVGLLLCFLERREESNRTKIARKWIRFPILYAVDFFAWWISMFLFVTITGGV